MNKPIFICELPPPFGGVTVKNQLLINNIFKPDEIEVLDLFDCKRNLLNIPKVFAKLLSSFISGRTIIYGFGSYKRLIAAVKLQKVFGGKTSLNNTVNIVMGGMFHNFIKDKLDFIKSLSKMKMHFVETEGMKKGLIDQGVKNVQVFPNAKSIKGSVEPQNRLENQLKCVYFSQISTKKGVAEIIKSYSLLNKEQRNNIHIDFYGHILDEIKADFEKFVTINKNINYFGVFDSTNNNVYDKLSEYDVLLFPTLWENEGVPGILVEAKIAGIAPIVSDRNFNAEIVRDKIEGLVLHSKYHDELKNALLILLEDKNILYALKEGSYASRKRFAIETYYDVIRNTIFI